MFRAVTASRTCIVLGLACWLARLCHGQSDYILRPVAGYPNVRTTAHFSMLWPDNLGIPVADAMEKTGLAQLESIRDFFLTKIKFPDPYAANPVKYKTNLYLIPTGYAYGSGEGGHPAMWLNPSAVDNSYVLAHEYTHALQYSSGGFVNNEYVGWIWESHANWMASQYQPDNPGCAEMYTRTAAWHYGSTRNRYCNWQFLEYLKDTEGIALINRLWTEGWPAPSSPAYRTEEFFSALMRLKKWGFKEMADAWGTFAMRMARYDFANGYVFRKNWEQNRPEWQMRLTRTPLEAIDSAQRRYAVPGVFAPQRYGYNIVRLRREAGQSRIRIAFQGVSQDRNNIAGYRKVRSLEPDSIPLPGSGWRFGIVAVDTAKATFRYSPLMSSGEAVMDLRPAESEVYLVVSATPVNRQLIKWDQMYYTIYRYPWMCEMHGAWPDGFQPGANAMPPGAKGARHPNGGGFVAATASVAATAYVGPHAKVVDGAKVSEQARIEDHAIVGGTAKVQGNAVISDYAAVWAGTVLGNAQVDGAASIVAEGTSISGRAHVGGQSVTWDPATLDGTVQILGDAEIRNITASKGVFYGLVDANTVASADMGADRTAPEPEATRPGPYAWGSGSGLVRNQSPRAGAGKGPRILILRDHDYLGLNMGSVSAFTLDGRRIRKEAIKVEGVRGK